MPTVTYHAHLEGRTASLSFDGLVLQPGPNDLEPAAAERLSRHPDLADYVARGVIEIAPSDSHPTLRFYRTAKAFTHGGKTHRQGESILLAEADAEVLMEMGRVELAHLPAEQPTQGEAASASTPPSLLSQGGEEEPEPEIPPAPLEKGGEGKNDTVSFLVDLNSASVAELVALPRIGEATANKLIAARPLASLQDAQFVAGMSNARWADVAPLVQVAHHTQVRP